MNAEIERLNARCDARGERIELLSARLAEAQAEHNALRAALESIASNTCCDRCQEAALVARAALGLTDSAVAVRCGDCTTPNQCDRDGCATQTVDVQR
jgi:hypothetical protein